jgi:hypothetical protein
MPAATLDATSPITAVPADATMRALSQSGLQLNGVEAGGVFEGATVYESSDGSYSAIMVCDPDCRVLVKDNATDGVSMISSPTFAPGRPFTDIIWVQTHQLQFDQWRQPHYGQRYVVDVANRELVDMSLISSP